MNYAIIASEVFTGEALLSKQVVCIKNGLIDAIIDQSSFEGSQYEHVIECEDGLLVPGFIDWQVNGGGGALFNNTVTKQALETITKAHHLGGTTGLLPTIISDTQEVREAAVKAIRQSQSAGNKSILGIHLEGPFFAEPKRGVHQSQYLSAMTQADVEWLCSINSAADDTQFPIVLTLAPEKTASGQIHTLCEHDIIVSAGHSDATSDIVNRAISEGLRGFTHLYNAMRPAQGREPGVVGAALLDDSTWCGIIVDGHHVHQDMIRLAHKVKPIGKICLVTDAMATVGSNDKSFELYGNTIIESEGRLISHEGKLAGAAISMADAVRLSHNQIGIELDECLKMASLYPAEFLRLDDHLGKIKVGYRADLVLLDHSLNVRQTWVAGEAKL